MPLETGLLLIVDDSAEIRELMEAILDGRGFELLGAASVDDAKRLMRARRPGLVFLDIRLGGGESGLDLCREIKSAGTASPLVIMLSGLNDAQTLSDALQGGADGYLTKPFTPAQIAGLVDTYQAWLMSPERSFPDFWPPCFAG